MKTGILIAIATVFLISTSQAQGLFGVRQRPVNHFKGTQWYVGVTTGMNHTRATVIQSFSEFSPVHASALAEKDYRTPDAKAGYRAGISTTVALTPYVQVISGVRYSNLKYAYQQGYQWSDPENEANQLLLNNEHTLSLGYVEVPLQVRYAFPLNRFKPFAQAGLVYGRQVKAHKKLVTHSVDYASGESAESVSHQQTSDVGASYLKSQAAYTLGGGMMYNFGGLMLVAEVNYQQGFHNITRARTRYTATRHLAGLGHVPDDVKLRALSYSVSFLFPLKFLTDKSFQPVTF